VTSLALTIHSYRLSERRSQLAADAPNRELLSPYRGCWSSPVSRPDRRNDFYRNFTRSPLTTRSNGDSSCLNGGGLRLLKDAAW